MNEDPAPLIVDTFRSYKAKHQPRGFGGKFVKKIEATVQAIPQQEITVQSTKTLDKKDPDPPLVSVKVTNPVTYIKKWWAKIIGNEGIDIRFKIHPLTALSIVFIIASGTFGISFLTNLVTSSPVVQYVPAFAQNTTPTPDPWVEGAYSGTLQTNSTSTYYLITNTDVIKLDAPENVQLTRLLGKRILATGRYNKETKVLYVTDAKDLEVLPIQATGIPTIVQLLR